MSFAGRKEIDVELVSVILNSVFKASPRRQGGGGSPRLRCRLSPPYPTLARLGDKAVVACLASP
jgi:hypothetical protein